VSLGRKSLCRSVSRLKEIGIYTSGPLIKERVKRSRLEKRIQKVPGPTNERRRSQRDRTERWLLKRSWPEGAVPDRRREESIRVGKNSQPGKPRRGKRNRR